MYDYRKMTPAQRRDVVEARRVRGFPWHTPPHFPDAENFYMLTATCFEHQMILTSMERLDEMTQALLEGLHNQVGGEVYAWVVLPNHYHLLARVDLQMFSAWIGRLHNGKATQWNREDHTPGRKVWYRFSDRLIRGEGHYFASLNYIHANPVKHGYAQRGRDWAWSSLHEYLETVGPEALADWWRRYPVGDYGSKWDDLPCS